jgi:hypothetical protein
MALLEGIEREMSISNPGLDLLEIQFPSDAVTFGQMRKLQPDLFTPEGLVSGRVGDIVLLSAMYSEHQLAETAFAAALGLQDPHSQFDRRDLILCLNSDYLKYGISTGLQQTYQLVRDFERAAVAQAQTHQPPPAGR